MAEKRKAALHGSTPADAVLRKWAADAEDPLALLALMAEGEDPALIVEKLRQALHDVDPGGREAAPAAGASVCLGERAQVAHEAVRSGLRVSGMSDDGTPVARRGDPETSWQAAESVTHVRESQRRVVAIIAYLGDATDQEIAAEAERFGWVVSPSGLRTRRSELVDKGLVIDSGRRRLTVAGRNTIVWILAEGVT